MIAAAGALAVSALAKATLHRDLLQLAQAPLADQALGKSLIFSGFVLAPTLACVMLFRQTLASSAWDVRAGSSLLGLGLAAGAGAHMVLVGLFWLGGYWQLRLEEIDLPTAAQSALWSAAVWLLVALGEEGLYRGYVLVRLSRAFAFWPSAIITSLWFGAGHLANPGESGVGVASTVLFGLVLAWSVRRTGSIWFAVGVHAAWNFLQSFVFGFNNSGGVSRVSLFDGRLDGPELVAGGAAGPEGSLLVLVPLLLLTALVARRRG